MVYVHSRVNGCQVVVLFCSHKMLNRRTVYTVGECTSPASLFTCWFEYDNSNLFTFECNFNTAVTRDVHSTSDHLFATF